MSLNENNLLSCIEIEPKQPANKTIIVMHGLGADGNDFVPIVSELNLPSSLAVRFVFPHAPVMPVTINNGYEMRAWYDILAMNIDRHVDQAGVHRSVREVEKLIERENERGITSENIILAGFSQGAAMALTTGLRYLQPLGGIIALSGYLPLAQATLHDAGEANKHTPIFIGHGTQDPVVPYVLGKTTETILKEAGYSVSWHHYLIPHSVSAEEIRDIGNWIREVWA